MDSIIIFSAKYLILGVLLIAILTWYKTSKRQEFILGLILASIVAYAFVVLAGNIYYHPRPFVVQNIQPLISHASDNGFPSEHTVAAMTITTVIYFYRKKFAALAFLITLGVAIGRVQAHVHSWIDIIGGLAIGIIAGYSGVVLGKWLLPKISAKRPAARR